VSGEVETQASARNLVAGSFFIKDDTHSEQTTSFSKANVATTTPQQTDKDRQWSFGLRDIVTLTSSLRATVGISADLLDGLQAQDLSSDKTQVVPFQVSGTCASDGTFQSCTAYTWAFNPGAAVTYSTPSVGSVFLTYGHKSRFPTIKDRYSYKAGRAIPNPMLEPERARTWTVGYSRAIATRTVAQVDVFRSDVRDEIENIFFLSPLCTGGGKGGAGSCQQAVNVGEELHAGVNLAVRSTPMSRLTVDANYGFLHREISNGSGALPTGTPTHKAVATVTGLLPHGISALVTFRHQSGTLALSDNGLPLPVANFTTTDIGGTFTLRHGISVQAGIKNLFDANYYYWEGFPEVGRNGYVTLRYAF
jgi:iron complex outermembrane receptor protein